MAQVYAVANRKGGCSKTTTCGALASGLTRRGFRVLAVDMDPQGNLTDWAGFDASDANTTYEVLAKRCAPREAIVAAKHYDLMPADESLSNLEAELANCQGREYRLKEALGTVDGDYDYILIDTPPQLSVFMPIAFTAVTGGIIVPTDNGRFATKGMNELRDTLSATRTYFNPNARAAGILMTKYNPRLNAMKVMKEVAARFGAYFDAPVYDTFIRQSVGVVEAQISCTDLFDSPRAARDGASQDYARFVDEFVAREEGEAA